MASVDPQNPLRLTLAIVKIDTALLMENFCQQSRSLQSQDRQNLQIRDSIESYYSSSPRCPELDLHVCCHPAP